MGAFILFGAGVYAKKYKALLEYLKMDFDYFTDNDTAKWGMVLYEKKVIAPHELKKFPDCSIIISSTHETAIRKQLADMGMEKNIIGLDTLYALCEKQMPEKVYNDTNTDGHHKTILIDMYEGIGWGGTELWAANLAYGLKETGCKVILIGERKQPPLEKKYELMAERISEKETIAEMTALIEKNLPCVLVNNFAGCLFMAASIVKKRHPDRVKIVSVIHNDNKSLFDAHMMMAGYIDKIFCVSSQICRHMQMIYDFDLNLYYFKEQPVTLDNSWERKYNKSGSLRIGYAARLVRQQKRADLITDLIGRLENKGLNYFMQIAGEGECLPMIERYLKETKIPNRVQLLGRLPKSEMDSFWKGQDVFVNVSEYEGTSLSMLEAMGYGCVPVVTDVSGAGEFIEQEKNGCICDVGDLEGIADCIAALADNRELLKIYGDRCRRIVQDRCNPDRYIQYWTEEVLGEWI